jgi:ribosomal protein L3 glutamine methyltransferase
MNGAARSPGAVAPRTPTRPTAARRRGTASTAPRAEPDAAAAIRSLQTVRDVLRFAVSRMNAAGVHVGQGTVETFDEAVWLVLWGLHLPPDRLEPFLDARLTPAEVRAAVSLIERRCVERMPAAYLTGEAWLRGLRFVCDPRALVPRSLLAELIDDDGLSPWIDDPLSVGSVLDLCTGGGSIAVFAARHFAAARVTGADLAAEALELAAVNVALHGLDDRIRLRRGNLYEAVADERFDLIVTNPPYVNAASMSALPPEFRHEPPAALAGGGDGMDLVRRIVSGARAHLNPGGLLVIEIGHEAAHFEAAFAGLEFGYLPTAGTDRAVVLLEHDSLP